MTQLQTCGKGLADTAALPARMAEVTGLLADILELHLPSLDLTDPLSQREHDVYQELFRGYREIAARMSETAQRMAGYRDLPMGRHDLQAAASPAMAATFEKFVQRKRDLLALLQELDVEDGQLLEAMRGAQQP
ncbi:MAG TPA: hypothetical protein VF062_16230 [Candidatus Limnocylindrales bacterium]